MIVFGTSPLFDQNENTAKYLKRALKVLFWSTRCTRHKPLCQEEPIWILNYVRNSKSHKTYFEYRNLLLKERQPENSKLQSYWNHSNVSLISSMVKEKPRPIQLQHQSKTENREIQKLSLHHSCLSKWQNSKSSEFLNIFFNNAPCWLIYNQREVLLFPLQSFLLQRNDTWRSSFGNQHREKLLMSSWHVYSWSKVWTFMLKYSN